MPRIPAQTLLLILVLLPGACMSVAQADLSRYAADPVLPIHTEPPPAGAQPMGVVHVQQDGFYLFGVVPIVKVSLQDCLDKLQEKAAKQGANGVADLEYRVSPADVFKFSVFPLPDWTAMVQMTGTAYKR